MGVANRNEEEQISKLPYENMQISIKKRKFCFPDFEDRDGKEYLLLGS